ncbi:MAG: efflux RND transporter periplasmic adaptor subunit [Halanaerobiales bacterium]
MKKYVFIILGIVFLALFLVLFKDSAGVNDMESSIEIFEIKTENTPEYLRATGIIIPEKTVEIRSNRSGTVINVVGEEGSRVSGGDLLLKYDNDVARADVSQADANLNQARSSLNQVEARKKESVEAIRLAEIRLENARSVSNSSILAQIEQADLKIENARKEVERNRKLYDNNAIEEVKLENSIHNLELQIQQKNILENNLAELRQEKDNRIQEAEQSLSQARTSLNTVKQDIEVARSAVQIAETNLNRAEMLLKKHSMYSPIDGVILDKNIQQGEYTQPGQLLYEISTENYLVRISPDERELNLLSVGKEGYISPDAFPDRRFKVKIERISPDVDIDRGTVEIYLELLEDTDMLLANMSVSVEITNNDNTGNIYVPEDYVFTESTGSNQSTEYVYLIREGKAEKRIISTGDRDNHGRIEIRNGLNKGDRIVLPDNIEEGQQIEQQSEQE